jgi:hypothetical protein
VVVIFLVVVYGCCHLHLLLNLHLDLRLHLRLSTDSFDSPNSLHLCFKNIHLH